VELDVTETGELAHHEGQMITAVGIGNSKSILLILNNIKEYCRIYPQLVKFVLAGTIVVH